MPITKNSPTQETKKLIFLGLFNKSSGQGEDKDERDKKQLKTLGSWIENAPYKRIEDYAVSKAEEIVLKDDTLLQFLRIEGRGASGASYEEQQIILSYFYTFLSKTSEHFTVEVTTVPLNMSRQIAHKQRRLNQLNRLSYPDARRQRQLAILKMMLQKKIEKFQRMEVEMTNIEYVVYLFGDDRKALEQTTKSFSKLAQGYRFNVSALTRSEKESILFQLNNMNTKL